MKEFCENFKNNGFVKVLNSFYSSKIFPFISAAVALACYILGWDLVTIYYLVISAVLILVFSDNTTPGITVLLFVPVLMSKQNSLSVVIGNSDYYTRTENLAQILTLLSLLLIASVYKIAVTCINKKFKLTPAFWILAVFSAALLFNGAFSKDYDPKNLIYGLVMVASFLFIFSLIKDNLKLDKKGFEQIALGFVALSILLVVELIFEYCRTEGIFENGIINRYKLIFGWGVYSDYGLLLGICIPPVLYLAGIKKYGTVYLLYSFVLFACAFLCCSRQTMVTVALIYPICLLILFVKGNNQILNLCVTAAAAIAAIIVLGIYQQYVIDFFKTIFDNLIVDGNLDGSGRMRLYKQALEYFKSQPFWGVGFYVSFDYSIPTTISLFPAMCHNTVLQVLSCSGIVGISAYAIHRIQTVVSFFKNVNLERTFIALSIASFVIAALFANHMFRIFSTMIYSALLAVLDKSEKKTV